MDLFQIEEFEPIFDLDTYIVPVNLTYYPIRAKENLLNHLAEHFMENLSDRCGRRTHDRRNHVVLRGGYRYPLRGTA